MVCWSLSDVLYGYPSVALEVFHLPAPPHAKAIGSIRSQGLLLFEAYPLQRPLPPKWLILPSCWWSFRSTRYPSATRSPRESILGVSLPIALSNSVSFSQHLASQIPTCSFQSTRLSTYVVSHYFGGFLHRGLHQLISSGKHSWDSLFRGFPLHAVVTLLSARSPHAVALRRIPTT